MGKKSEFPDVAIMLFVLVGIIYPLVWLYEKFGPFGFWFILISLSALIAASIYIRKMNSANAFNELVLYALNNRMNPQDAQQLNLKLAKTDFPRSRLIRNLQIMRDSIDICLSSKNRKTAESHLDLVLSAFEEICKELQHLIKHETLLEIERVVLETQQDFHTRLYLNVAYGHIEKARRMKTTKARQKYRELAIQTLMEGIQAGRGKVSELNSALEGISRD